MSHNPQDKRAVVPPPTHPICSGPEWENYILGVLPTGPRSVFLTHPLLAPGAPAP